MMRDSPHRTAPLGRRQVLIVLGGVVLEMLLGSRYGNGGIGW
jgi:hypothetical protein